MGSLEAEWCVDWKPWKDAPKDAPIFGHFSRDDETGMMIRVLKFKDNQWQQEEPNTGQYFPMKSTCLGWKPMNGQPGGGPPTDWGHEKVWDWVARMWTPGYDVTRLNPIDGMTMCGLAMMMCATITKDNPDAELPNSD